MPSLMCFQILMPHFLRKAHKFFSSKRSLLNPMILTKIENEDLRSLKEKILKRVALRVMIDS